MLTTRQLCDASSDLDSDGRLDYNEVWVYSVEVTIAAHDDAEVNPIINTATADGDDFDGDPLTQVQDTHMTTIKNPTHLAGILIYIEMVIPMTQRRQNLMAVSHS
ncbi:MAG: hypothetical protein ACXACE_16270 [Candidatus Thorarchaeota archaeon]